MGSLLQEHLRHNFRQGRMCRAFFQQAATDKEERKDSHAKI